MARLTSTSLVFSTGNEITSKSWIYPSGTVKVFYQAAAPVGWAQTTTHNDKALRVVSGNGGGSGGTTVLSSAFTNFSVSGPWSCTTGTGNGVNPGGGSMTAAELPAHAHASGGEIGLAINPINPAGAYTGGDVAVGGGWSRNSPGTGGEITTTILNISFNGSHTHPYSSSGTTPAQPVNLAVNYVDMIICSYNG